MDVNIAIKAGAGANAPELTLPPVVIEGTWCADNPNLVDMDIALQWLGFNADSPVIASEKRGMQLLKI
jgi:hypothetical protein